MPAIEAAQHLPVEWHQLSELAAFQLELVDDLQHEIGRSGSLAGKIASWLVMLKVLHHFEGFVRRSDSTLMRLHRTLLDVCRNCGEALLLEAQQLGGITREQHGLDEGSLRAHLDWLRDKFTMWHGEMTPARKAEILHGVFGIET
jgi:hypothetical protein